MNVETVYGVDFSGAREAGENVWVTELAASGDPAVSACQRAPTALAEYYDGESTTARAATMDALASFVSALPATAAVGFDFPFSVPKRVARGVFGADTWDELVEGVADCADAAEFAQRCVEWAQEHTDGTYLKREPDAVLGAFSPYHFFVQAQTYHGISAVLAPVREAVTVVPFDAWEESPQVAEVYPAGTLDGLGLSREGYKGRDESEWRRRARNVARLTATTEVQIPDEVRQTLVDDHEGDALDSLVAAVAVLDNVDEFEYGTDCLEGRIYA